MAQPDQSAIDDDDDDYDYDSVSIVVNLDNLRQPLFQT